MTYIPKHSLVAYHCLWFLWFLVSGLFHPTSQSPAVHLHAWQLSFMPRVVVVRMEAFGLRQGISWQLRCPLAGCIFVSTSSWRLTHSTITKNHSLPLFKPWFKPWLLIGIRTDIWLTPGSTAFYRRHCVNWLVYRLVKCRGTQKLRPSTVRPQTPTSTCPSTGCLSCILVRVGPLSHVAFVGWGTVGVCKKHGLFRFLTA